MSCAESQAAAPPPDNPPNHPVDAYTDWLRSARVPLFRAGSAWWRIYHRVLLPASLDPRPIQVPKHEAERALRESGCLFLRHFTRAFEHPTEFWHVSCSQYDFDKLSANTRSKLRRGQKRCSVRLITEEWLVANGYPCYAAAHTRYENAAVLSPREFEANESKCIGGPFELWGVFCEDHLAGYARCVVGEGYAATLVLKFHPEYLKLYSAYALVDAILTRYVRAEGKIVTNGFRSLAHDTNMQQFLEQFAFRRIYCDLRIVYRPWLAAGLRCLYPLRTLCDGGPGARFAPGIRDLLAQERIRRSFLPQSPSVATSRTPTIVAPKP